MFPARSMNGMSWEIVKWIALAILALALTLMLTHGMPAAEPGQLPAAIKQMSRPMDVEPRIGTGVVDPAAMPPEMWFERIWGILEHQRAGRFEEAVAGWRETPLDEPHSVWRELALGQALLQLGNLEGAESHFMNARDRDPENPVVHFLLGRMRLTQAAVAREWLDAVGPIRWVAYVEASPGTHVPPHNKSLYELMAIYHFETSLEFVHLLHEEEPIVAGDPWSTLALEPRVRDLLPVLGADQLAAQAAEALGFLYLEHDRLNESEAMFGRAVEEGANERFGYESLGGAYERNGMPVDAVRAYAKALTQGGPLLGPAKKLLRNLGHSFDDLW